MTVVLASGIVIANLLYPLGAVVAIVILSLVVTLRHRKPKSLEANMASFNRGLKALAPDAEPVHKRGRAPQALPSPPPVRSVRTVVPQGGRIVRPESLQGPAAPLATGEDPTGASSPHHDREAETG